MLLPHSLFALVATLALLHTVDGAVMSADIGAQFVKLAIVKPGVPMEIVLNKESRRKTPDSVYIDPTDRIMGDDAAAKAVKKPLQTFSHLKRLIGKRLSHPDVKEYQKFFPHYTLTERDDGTLAFQANETHTFSVEELLAMNLEYYQMLAESYAEEPTKDAVVTVPAYFDQAERIAVLRAASIAGLKVIQLMGEPAAIALQFGIFRRKDFNATPQYYLIFDMGAFATTATIVSYETVKQSGEVFPQLQLRGVGFDRSLGSLHLQLMIRDHLSKVFNAEKKVKADITKDNRAMAKLFKEAGRVKHILSANQEATSQIEGLIEDTDYRTKMTRADLELAAEDFFKRVKEPVLMAIKQAGITMAEIKEVLLMGAGTRVPRVQTELLAVTGVEALGKSLNTDEAAAIGASYHAASASAAFKVLKFAVKESVLYPIQVEFESKRTVDPSDEKVEKTDEQSNLMRRTLFEAGNPYPQKKVLTFNKHVDDFSFVVKYGDQSHLPENSRVKNGDLMEVKVTGVSEMFAARTEQRSRGIKAHFRLDESGIIRLDSIEGIFEEDRNETEADAGLFDGMAKKLSGLFGSEDKNETTTEKAEGDEEKKTEKSEEETKKSEGEEKTEAPPADGAENKTEPAKPAEPKIKTVTHKVPLTFAVELRRLKEPDEKTLDDSRALLKVLRERDAAKDYLAKVKNDLEAYILNNKVRLEEELWSESVSAEEKETLLAELNKASEWYEWEAEDGTPAETYVERLTELKALCKEWVTRVRQHQKRPQAYDDLAKTLNVSEVALSGFKNISKNMTDQGEDAVFTDIELETLGKLINETYAWKTEKLNTQKDQAMHTPVVVTITDIEAKAKDLHREVGYLMNKMKVYKPKPKTTPKPEKTAEGGKAKKTTEGETSDAKKPDADKTESGSDKPKEDKTGGATPEDTVPPPPAGDDVEKEIPITLEGDSKDSTTKDSKTTTANADL